jgi:heat shock protein HslJ
MMRVVIALGVASVLTVGRVTAAPAATSPIVLEGPSWKAIELGGRPVGPARRGLEARLVFAHGAVKGADGCGPVTGSYQTMGPVIKFGQLRGGTACTGGTETGRALRTALAAAHVFRVKDQRLELFDGTGTILARFAVPGPSVAPSVAAPGLAGTSWRFVKFHRPDGAGLENDPASYTLDFRKNGNLAAAIGCHRAQSTWRASGRSDLQITALALSGARCSSGPLHDHLVRNLGSVRSYTIRSGHLFLSLMGDAGVYELEPLKPAK